MSKARLPLLLVLLGCTTSQRPTMNPGVDCIRCHTQATDVTLPSAIDAAGQRAGGLVFSAAGTVFRTPGSPATDGVENVHLFISNALVPDAGVEVVSNHAGNFYTAESIFPATGLTVSLEYRGQSVTMRNHPTPIQLYGPTTSVVGVGCNGCHMIPAAPNVAPDAGPVPSCGLPDGGTFDATAGLPCSGDLGCCSLLCVSGSCAQTPGPTGAACTSSNDCQTLQCVDGLCSDTLGENLHGCTSGADCRLGYCEGNICTGAPGRISIPDGVALPDGGFGYSNP